MWFFRFLLSFGLTCFLFFTDPPIALAKDTNFSSYEDLRKQLNEHISAAKERIWIASRSLSDPVIAEVLFAAQNRNVDVKLLLAPTGAQSVSAKGLLTLFSAQKIFFALDPQMRVETTTAILLDDKLMWLDLVLGELSGARTFSLLHIESQDKARLFSSYFETHSGAVISMLEKKKEWEQLPSVFEYRKHPTQSHSQLSRKLPKILKSKINKDGD